MDVGTAALGQGLHNASSGRAPILIFAGVAPSTLHGEIPGSRSEHVQWYQDIPNQAAIVSPYSRYSAEIKTAKNVQTVIHRALLMATTGSPGPVYLTATREILAEPIQSLEPRLAPLPSCILGALPEDAVELISDALLQATAPLVITGYLGRNHRAVKNLISLADLLKGIKVFDSELREVCFPADHPAYVTRGTGAAKAVQTADVILVLDSDVPWIPFRVRPSSSAKIIHIDLDPRKERMNLFDIGAYATYHADTASALQQIHRYLSNSEKLALLKETFNKRWEELKHSHAQGKEVINSRAAKALSAPENPCHIDFLCSKIRWTVPEETIFVTDSVTNQVFVTEQLQLTRPGSHLTKGGSGLGWAGGAAIGVKLATALYDISDRPNIRRKTGSEIGTSPFVCMITGDGSFVFSAPTAVYWASHRYGCPFLTVILNNGGWRATRQCITDVHPQGLATGVSNADLGISLEQDGPDYGQVAKAAANGNLWTKKVERVADLEEVLKEAVSVVVNKKISAVVDVVIR